MVKIERSGKLLPESVLLFAEHVAGISAEIPAHAKLKKDQLCLTLDCMEAGGLVDEDHTIRAIFIGGKFVFVRNRS